MCAGRLFYDACTSPAWKLALEGAGHFQFLDSQTLLQRSICNNGHTTDSAVRLISQVRSRHGRRLCKAVALLLVLTAMQPEYGVCSQAATVTWAELMVRQRLGLSRKTVPPAEGLQAVADFAAQLLRQTPAARGRLRANDAYALSSEYKHLSS